MRKYLKCVGPGWSALLLDLIDKIESYLDKHPDYAEEFEVLQVKEKFAGLRFYYSPMNDDVRDLVSKAEAQSLKICEDCGAPGKVEQPMRFWFKTLCEECLDRRRPPEYLENDE